MHLNEAMPAWTWEEVERELLALTPAYNRIMTRHLLEVTREGALTLSRQELLHELLVTIMLADGPSSFERSPSTEPRLAS